MTNPSEKVTSSTMLWSDQVGLVNASEMMDSATHETPFWNDYTPGGQVVIYYFGARLRRFVRPNNPYA